MKTLTCMLVLFLLKANTINCQTNSLNKARPVKIVASDARTFKGKVVEITTDYIILDLPKDQWLNGPTPYYLRPVGNKFRIDVEYIRTAYTKKRKGVGKAAISGVAAGIAGFGTVGYLTNESSEEQFKDALVGAGIGAVIGGIAGTITGLFTHKKWYINGSSVNLAAFRDYYF